jgi:hypothetical protein
MIGRSLMAGFAWVLALAGLVPVAAQGNSEMVSAAKPAGMVIALMNAGYDAQLAKDSRGDPLIRVGTGAYPVTIAFYGCDETTNSGCDSVQLITGLDRSMPWTAESALALMREYRFIAVNLDDDGDPILTWDVYTGSGIPARAFLETVSRFESVVSRAADAVFAP